MSGRPILLDTCAALWLSADDALSPAAESALAEAAEAGQIVVSPITAWEIGLLVARDRIALSRPPLAWFETLIRLGVALAPMPPSVLVDSSFLPAPAPRDPADRIIAATARAFGYRLMTRDRFLLDYGEGGHLDVVAC